MVYRPCMRVWSALVLLSVTALASAQVYRSVAPDGSVQFSDYPLTPNATVIEVQPAQTVPMGAGARPPAPVAAPAGAGRSPAAYRRFEILSPGPDEAVRANDGNVSVALDLEPPLSPGHRVVVRVDGQPAGGAEGSLGVTLVNLSRGTHQLDAVVVNASGETVASAGPVTFHVLRVHLPAPRPHPR